MKGVLYASNMLRAHHGCRAGHPSIAAAPVRRRCIRLWHIPAAAGAACRHGCPAAAWRAEPAARRHRLAAAQRRRPATPRRPASPLVMLDPGHGGKDPGAIGVSGTYEKHIALATALELKRQLEASGRYRVELTRSRDVFIPLDDRVRSGAAAGRVAVRLDARGRAGRPFGARRIRLYAGPYRVRRADRRARPAREQRRPVHRPAMAAPRRPRSRISLPVWCGRKRGPDPRALPARMVGCLDRICRCCRTQPGMPASSC